MNANTSRKAIHFSDNMEAKDENALSSRLRALIRKKRDENVSTFPAKKGPSEKHWVSEKKLLKDIFEQLSTETTHTNSFKRWLVQVREVWKLFHRSNLPAKPQEPLHIV